MSIHEASVARMQALKPGDPVTNICAGTGNPTRHTWFVAYEAPEHKNKYGIVMRDHWARCRNSSGGTVRIGIDVIHPGHLNEQECEQLFAPVWQARYAPQSAADPS